MLNLTCGNVAKKLCSATMLKSGWDSLMGLVRARPARSSAATTFNPLSSPTTRIEVSPTFQLILGSAGRFFSGLLLLVLLKSYVSRVDTATQCSATAGLERDGAGAGHCLALTRVYEMRAPQGSKALKVISGA
jgi:hypothetical protein